MGIKIALVLTLMLLLWVTLMYKIRVYIDGYATELVSKIKQMKKM